MQDVGQPPDDMESAQASVIVRYQRDHADSRCIVGISVEFGEESLASSIAGMTMALTQAGDRGIFHVLKLTDPEMHEQHRQYARELFAIEMRLREILSMIFIETFSGADFYSLLSEVEVTVATKDLPQPDYLRAHAENEFFFLLFSSYVRLNSRKRPTKVEDLIGVIEESSDFEDRLPPFFAPSRRAPGWRPPSPPGNVRTPSSSPRRPLPPGVIHSYLSCLTAA